jgi:hypothetical protein
VNVRWYHLIVARSVMWLVPTLMGGSIHVAGLAMMIAMGGVGYWYAWRVEHRRLAVNRARALAVWAGVAPEGPLLILGALMQDDGAAGMTVWAGFFMVGMAAATAIWSRSVRRRRVPRVA